jgi:hypothetical protein
MGGYRPEANDAGLSFSTAGASPVNFLFGQLDATSLPEPQRGRTPGIVGLSMGVTSTQEFSVTPRALVPVDSNTTPASVGTSIRAEVSPHLSLVTDVGAAGTARHGTVGIRWVRPASSGTGVARNSKPACFAARPPSA